MRRKSRKRGIMEDKVYNIEDGLPPEVVKDLKIRRAMEYAEVVEHICTGPVLEVLEQDPKLIDWLTARELGHAMVAISRGLQRGYMLGYTQAQTEQDKKEAK
jgi:hypothetical protein